MEGRKAGWEISRKNILKKYIVPLGNPYGSLNTRLLIEYAMGPWQLGDTHIPKVSSYGGFQNLQIKLAITIEILFLIFQLIIRLKVLISLQLILTVLLSRMHKLISLIHFTMSWCKYRNVSEIDRAKSYSINKFCYFLF